MRFENAQSAAPLTGPSHATILTGQYPPQHGVRENVNFLLDPSHVTLATRLKRRGYHTGAFVGAYPVAAAFGFGQDVDHFSEGLHPNPGIGQGAERPANEVAATRPRPGCARRPCPSSHGSISTTRTRPTRAAAALPRALRGSALRRRDRVDGRELGRILDGLRAAGHGEDTLVIVLADHGEGLGEHDEGGHGILAYQSTLRVPLLVSGPGVAKGRIAKDAVGTIDVVPTVLALLGLDAAADLPGRSLRPALEGRALPPSPLYAEALFGRLNCRWSSLRGWREGDWQLIEGAAPELFHLATDPGERVDRSGEEPERVRKMRSALKSAVAAMAPGGDRARPVAVSTEQMERLRSLGYTAGGGGTGGIDEPGLPDPRRLVSVYERLETLQSVTGSAVAPAIREIAGLLSLDPGSPFAHFVMAAVAYRGGELGLAEKAFQRTLDLDPDRPVIRQYYGALLRDMGRLEESEQQLRIAVTQAPESDFMTRINLAETLTALGKNGEAEQALRHVLEREPHHAKAKAALGRVLVAEGRASEAVPYLEAAAQGKEPGALLDLAGAYLRLGEAAKAGEAAGRALARSPGHPWALALAGHALVLEGRHQEGLALLQRALAIGPRRAEVWRALGAAFAAAGDTRSAERCEREAQPSSSRGSDAARGSTSGAFK